MKRIPFDAKELRVLCRRYRTPLYVYDEAGIRNNARALHKAFSWAPSFRNFFAVKATPTPGVLSLLREEGMGFDCSTISELLMVERMGVRGEDIMFTSNDTPAADMKKAAELGAIINLDDISHIDFLNEVYGISNIESGCICFRYNPGNTKMGNAIIGEPVEAKYGLTTEHIFEGYEKARSLGIRRFGLHAMVASNELASEYFADTARMLFTLARQIKQELGIRLEFINLGGGIGIPYTPEQKAVDYGTLSRAIETAYKDIIVPASLAPMEIKMENGRVITGPYAFLLSKVLHTKHTYKSYLGLDASMADLMRPGMYGAYHHISVVGKEDKELSHTYDVTGGLCENNDKFAIDRKLPRVTRGDIVVIHDVGAHGHAMGFNYNGKLRAAEVVRREDGTACLVRRAQTVEDYFSTIVWEEESAEGYYTRN